MNRLMLRNHVHFFGLRSGSQGCAVVVTALFFLLSTACLPRDHDGSGQRGSPAVKPIRRSLGQSIQGRPIDYVTFGTGRDIVLIMATIHGDEDAGTPLVERLIEHLSGRSDLVEGRRIVLIPNLNPDGHAMQTRFNARGVDLNRNFPAINFSGEGHHGAAPLSEPESAGLHALLDRERPRRIVSIHQPLNYGKACIDYDGPGEALARAMAERTDIPVQRIGSRPGSLGSYAGETLGIPIITWELPKEAKDANADTLWRNFGPALLSAIEFRPSN